MSDNSFKLVLAVETSCDDTSVALVKADGYVVSVLSANQDLEHKDFGGVVPEIAGRNHSLNLLPLMDKLLKSTDTQWEDIDGLAVTNRPGLVGSLLVGLVSIKTIAIAKQLPFVGVNHLEAHLLAPFLKDESYEPPQDFQYPYVALAVSGGHTQLYVVESFGRYKILGKTLDDAAGEAFDKFGKLLGLGFPGGIKVDQHAKEGDVKKYNFPRSLIREDNYNFSFSGLKASAQRLIKKIGQDEKRQFIHSLCASYQEAIVDVLLFKLKKACEELNIPRAVVTGGVSANSRLRARAKIWQEESGVQVVIPPIRYCTDNAAMVGYVGIERLNRGEVSPQDLKPMPRLDESEFLA
ncbi:MAG: tRNA (adenosine(37)-N6)-threonylcarbamoyltransferase complex transferase subunit TsaD [Bdellovibrionaceae bacterium]|jgi:N6-L-threonylcarbamoyladenine synthase|nr:tRNA (adenosine(37)-N6)-threonylcarbamoyltransferase complex transferase subunit TsaD [Pseudobdellovibrionaceae bacterium]